MMAQVSPGRTAPATSFRMRLPSVSSLFLNTVHVTFCQVSDVRSPSGTTRLWKMDSRDRFFFGGAGFGSSCCRPCFVSSSPRCCCCCCCCCCSCCWPEEVLITSSRSMVEYRFSCCCCCSCCWVSTSVSSYWSAKSTTVASARARVSDMANSGKREERKRKENRRKEEGERKEKRRRKCGGGG